MRAAVPVDMDGDGDLYILAGSTDGTGSNDLIAWYENDGTGTYNGTPNQITTEHVNLEWLEAGDIDGDGDMDVLAANKDDGSILLYRNTGGGSFSPKEVLISTIAAGYARFVKLADMDDDGDLDIISQGDTGTKLVWYENDGTGSIIDTHSIHTSLIALAINYISVGDLDNNGTLDVVTSTRGQNTIDWYKNLYEPDIELTGNSNDINDVDAATSATNHTDFGSVAAVSGTVTRTFTIENNGNKDLNLDGAPVVDITGTHAGDFSVTSQPAPTNINPSGSTTFQVEFDPSAISTRDAEITIDNDDPDEDPFNFAISGTGTNTPPAFTSSNSATFAENGTGTVLDINANDGDGGVNDAGITYSITGGVDMADFNIDANTGELTFTAAPDFESPTDSDTNNDYALEVTADDGVETATQAITVDVTDVNDAPIFTSTATTNFAENGTGTALDVNANDGDGGADDVGITYSITGGTDAADFNIDVNTGELTFVSAPDFENPDDANTDNDYEIEVTADDGVQTATQSITITVTDVLEVPVFTSAAATNFTENGTGTALDVEAHDGDGGATDAGITYSIFGGTDAADFNIDANTGELTFVSAPDFESPDDANTDNDYEIEVTADDGTASNNTATQTITITVTDATDAPIFTSAASTTFAENGTGTALDIDANDGDGGDGGGVLY
ncbi:cadherin domain-containing protein [Gracilimonas sp.]|uniref:cadherin domain-containing protein n=1 Tax=Gracilimonas sp. TaxID=1974203 RepID=UPI002870BDF6|nr:cadherin domain-containing protein [Gracilimonas sp.]